MSNSHAQPGKNKYCNRTTARGVRLTQADCSPATLSLHCYLGIETTGDLKLRSSAFSRYLLWMSRLLMQFLSFRLTLPARGCTAHNKAMDSKLYQKQAKVPPGDYWNGPCQVNAISNAKQPHSPSAKAAGEIMDHQVCKDLPSLEGQLHVCVPAATLQSHG